jgi:hypothetical protein
MVGTHLTNEMIQAGAKLIKRLEERGMKPNAALWLYSTDADRWRLHIAGPSIADKDPMDSYRKIQRVLHEFSGDFGDLALDDISLAIPDVLTVDLLRSIVRTRTGVRDIRLRDNAFNGKLIEDAYIYGIDED